MEKELKWKRVEWVWVSPSDAHPIKYQTPKGYQWILYGLDRLGLPLYYSPYIWDLPYWRITPSQRKVLKKLLEHYPEGSDYYHRFGHFIHKKLGDRYYNKEDKSILNSILYNHWDFFGQEGTIPSDVRNPYPSLLRWKGFIDRLFKWRVEPIYEYE